MSHPSVRRGSALLLLLSFGAGAQAPPRGRVTGAAGQPVAGARVRWSRDFAGLHAAARAVRTDARGAFVPAPQPGGLYLVAAPSHAARLCAAPCGAAPRIALRRPTHRARACVVDARRRPVAGALCEAHWGGSYARGRTGADGSVVLAGLAPYEPGPALLVVHAPGFATGLAPLVVASATRLEAGTVVLNASAARR